MKQLTLILCLCSSLIGQDDPQTTIAQTSIALKDVFELEYASDPRIAPNGSSVVYVRRFFDIMTDRSRSNLWVAGVGDNQHRPLTTGNANDSQPRWSPDGSRIAYVSSRIGGSQLWLRFMDSGQTAKLTNLRNAPTSLSWSQDGAWLAFSMFVEDVPKPFVKLPKKPHGAKWAPPAEVKTRLRYRADGQGYLRHGNFQLFIVPADGGTPRQVTKGANDHRGPINWTTDNKQLIISANLHAPDELEPLDSEIYELSIATGTMRALTNRRGPDSAPVLSPDGTQIAYTGFDDTRQGYTVTALHVMPRQGGKSRIVTVTLDRSVRNVTWLPDGKSLLYLYDDHGHTKIALQELDGKPKVIADDVGGATLGRPYASGSFTTAKGNSHWIAYTQGTTHRPADVAITNTVDRQTLTHLNEDLLGHKTLAPVEEQWTESSFDKRRIQYWIAKPPGFDPKTKYPMILEIHGGPFANYGARFSSEMQVYAARGYVVVYANPRGSTSYGQEFGNLIHHDYPNHDYDDLMSVVDAVIEEGYVDDQNLFVTGGSGGGVLSAWIVGKTNRFAAAVVAKPVINWFSFALTADGAAFFGQYWFAKWPWEDPDGYYARSPISLVGKVTTPTMLLTGEADYRTPISETEQYFTALRLRNVKTAMVRIPEAGHGIASRPSHLISKVAHVLEWFEQNKR